MERNQVLKTVLGLESNHDWQVYPWIFCFFTQFPNKFLFLLKPAGVTFSVTCNRRGKLLLLPLPGVTSPYPTPIYWQTPLSRLTLSTNHLWVFLGFPASDRTDSPLFFPLYSVYTSITAPKLLRIFILMGVAFFLWSRKVVEVKSCLSVAFAFSESNLMSDT